MTLIQHRRRKDYEEGDMVLVHLRRERFPKSTYHKLKSKKLGPCKIINKISSNAYVIELPAGLQINPIFNVANLYAFEGFDESVTTLDESVANLPKEQAERNFYRRFLIKWLGKSPSESTWITEEELQRADPEAYEEFMKAYSSELSSLPAGEDDAEAFRKLKKSNQAR